MDLKKGSDRVKSYLRDPGYHRDPGPAAASEVFEPPMLPHHGALSLGPGPGLGESPSVIAVLRVILLMLFIWIDLKLLL